MKKKTKIALAVTFIVVTVAAACKFSSDSSSAQGNDPGQDTTRIDTTMAPKDTVGSKAPEDSSAKR